MKPRFIKRIIKEDFPTEVRAWIDTLLYPLNGSIEQINQILEKNVSLIDNLAAESRTIQVEGSSLIKGSTNASSNVITNASYYQATIDGRLIGPRPGNFIKGVGIPPQTSILDVNNTSIILSKPLNLQQLNGSFLAGGNFPVRILHQLTFRPTSVFISKISNLDGSPTQITEGVTPQWRLEANEIVIDGISGLESGRSYNITFIIL